MTKEESYFLGFDLSTQQLKCLAIDQDLKIVTSQNVDFDTELPQYNTNNGVYIHADVVECPVAMWIEAVDLVFKKFASAAFPLNKVSAISGSCQQHGSVYWSKEANALLNSLHPNKGMLVEQLCPHAFTRANAPNWQDHSTAKQCEEMENKVCGSQEMARISGSRAHFRFTGPQILKIAEQEKELYESTEHITLVSNFLTSLLCGKLVSLDEADACGMNLYDINEKKYCQPLVDFINEKSNSSLLDKLKGAPISCQTPQHVGEISSYFVQKFDLDSKCAIFPLTGDNLATICSLPLQKNDVLISMGTSTTVLVTTDQYHPSPNYHLFIHPTLANHYMGMICYCNGALARSEVCHQINVLNNVETKDDWTLFDKALFDDSIKNDDELGIYFPLGEIVPSVKPTYKRVKFDRETGELKQNLDSFRSVLHDAKNIIESQALSCRARITPLLNSSGKIDQEVSERQLKFDYDQLPLSAYLNNRPKRAFFVGGASKNDAIVKKFAQIIGATDGNYRLKTSNSCALGGCYKALWSFMYTTKQTALPFDEFLSKNFHWEDVEYICDSNEECYKAYSSKLIALSNIEAILD
ncbi:hypothetical protein KAFR_0C06220 [Kazachstania africana CBS 2517]|uniref:Xylulose kinase n=1 Tax=Kazachstania africana (strain ATCC 22294 / BCRC 22015 / CBS 2517 / CECT 1963 / NBRC 1671 / NRRL Y-8276) TaxID=1071382 RepID=H2ATB4_KAZAF|nr:hypothetical protein KAFR_0C06220 [Kazachstania africana CBS 2517]CCF57614.1 hypothetical protein KAFR_0C06220 [Kazachstania africana CBS 2517]